MPLFETCPDWSAIHYLALECGRCSKTCDPALLLPKAQALSDRYPNAIDFAFLVARFAENADGEEIARNALRRVFSIRSQHSAAHRLLERLDGKPECGRYHAGDRRR